MSGWCCATWSSISAPRPATCSPTRSPSTGWKGARPASEWDVQTTDSRCRLRRDHRHRPVRPRAARRHPARSVDRAAGQHASTISASTRRSWAPAPAAASRISASPPAILRGQQVAPHSRMMVNPGSREVFRQAMAEGSDRDHGGGRRNHRRARLRALLGLPPGHDGRWRKRHHHSQPQFQGPHGSLEGKSTSLRPPPSPHRPLPAASSCPAPIRRVLQCA